MHTFLLLSSLLTMTATAAPPPDGPVCLAQWEIERSRSVLAEHRAQGVKVNDFAEAYPAETPDPATWTPVPVVERFVVDGTPLLWFSEDKQRVVVHAGVLGPLTVADPTRMDTGASAEVGTIAEGARGKLPPRDLVEFLVRSQAIATFWHMGASLCLVEETTEPVYRARFAAEHEYYTNEENHDAYGFTVVLEADGRIRVEVP